MSIENYLGPLPTRTEAILDVTTSENALVIVDMLKGFCHTGPLQSPNNDRLKHPIASLVSKFKGPILSIQDAHTEQDDEFNAFPPHCISGTEEAELVEPIKTELSKHPNYEVLEKRTLSPFFGASGYSKWLKKQIENNIKNFYVVGNCTDLCVYQTALGTKLWLTDQDSTANIKVIVDMVDTFDLPKNNVPEGVLPHPRDVFHQTFLHHLAINNIQLVSLDK